MKDILYDRVVPAVPLVVGCVMVWVGLAIDSTPLLIVSTAVALMGMGHLEARLTESWRKYCCAHDELMLEMSKVDHESKKSIGEAIQTISDRLDAIDQKIDAQKKETLQ